MLPARLVKRFPKLQGDGAQKTSEATRQYNCIAWSAARDKNQWWQPLREEPWDYWPEDVPDDFSFESFVLIFEKRGYEKCLDSTLELFYKKVAIYADADGFTHVSDQLSSGAWTSKLGDLEDVQHNSLEALEGDIGVGYGQIKQILRKRCANMDVLKRIFFKITLFIYPSHRYTHKIR
jgi:hypothetical protein